MLKIAVCDDEKVITGQIESMLLTLCGQEGIAVDIEGWCEQYIHSVFKYFVAHRTAYIANQGGIPRAGKKSADREMCTVVGGAVAFARRVDA